MKDGYVKKSDVIAIAEKFVFTSDHDRKKHLDFVESCLIAAENLAQDEVKEIRNKAIDETVKRFKDWMLENDGLSEKDIRDIDEITEQMKGGE